MRIESPRRRQQPHDLRPGESFDEACIYIHDSGRVACGRHVGTEATYTPQAWSCLGLGPSYRDPEGGITFECEDCKWSRERAIEEQAQEHALFPWLDDPNIE